MLQEIKPDEYCHLYCTCTSSSTEAALEGDKVMKYSYIAGRGVLRAGCSRISSESSSMSNSPADEGRQGSKQRHHLRTTTVPSLSAVTLNREMELIATRRFAVFGRTVGGANSGSAALDSSSVAGRPAAGGLRFEKDGVATEIPSMRLRELNTDNALRYGQEDSVESSACS